MRILLFALLIRSDVLSPTSASERAEPKKHKKPTKNVKKPVDPDVVAERLLARWLANRSNIESRLRQRRKEALQKQWMCRQRLNHGWFDESAIGQNLQYVKSIVEYAIDWVKKILPQLKGKSTSPQKSASILDSVFGVAQQGTDFTKKVLVKIITQVFPTYVNRNDQKPIIDLILKFFDKIGLPIRNDDDTEEEAPPETIVTEADIQAALRESMKSNEQRTDEAINDLLKAGMHIKAPSAAVHNLKRVFLRLTENKEEQRIFKIFGVPLNGAMWSSETGAEMQVENIGETLGLSAGNYFIRKHRRDIQRALLGELESGVERYLQIATPVLGAQPDLEYSGIEDTETSKIVEQQQKAVQKFRAEQTNKQSSAAIVDGQGKVESATMGKSKIDLLDSSQISQKQVSKSDVTAAMKESGPGPSSDGHVGIKAHVRPRYLRRAARAHPA